MSLSIATMLQAGLNPNLEAAVMKDIGTTFEQEIPEAVHALTGAEPRIGSGTEFEKTLGYLVQHAPSFSLTRRHARSLARHHRPRSGSEVGRGEAEGEPSEYKEGSKGVMPAMNELQTILAETCTRLFTDHATTAVLEGAEKGEWPAALWQALEENGLTLPQVPEARGGAGGSWNDAFVVLMAAGRFAAPVPLAETILAGSILAEAGLDAPLGPMTVAPVHIDEGLTLARQGGGFTLSGRATRVPWGARAEHVVVVADAGGSPMIALVAGSARQDRGRREPRA